MKTLYKRRSNKQLNPHKGGVEVPKTGELESVNICTIARRNVGRALRPGTTVLASVEV